MELVAKSVVTFARPARLGMYMSSASWLEITCNTSSVRIQLELQLSQICNLSIPCKHWCMARNRVLNYCLCGDPRSCADGADNPVHHAEKQG